MKFKRLLIPRQELLYITQGLRRLKLDSLSDYYKSVYWMAKRNAFRNRTAYRCRCGETSCLNLHHKTYKNLGNEKNDDLMWLCESCHYLEHCQWTIRVMKERNERYAARGIRRRRRQRRRDKVRRIRKKTRGFIRTIQ